MTDTDTGNMHNIRLVIPGGGVIGNVYLAGLKSLVSEGYRVSAVSGSSAGAIVALVASTLTESRISDPEFWAKTEDIVSRALSGRSYTSDLSDLFVGTMISIQVLRGLIEELVLFLLGDRDATFESADLDSLFISAYEFRETEKSGIIYFSKRETPRVKIVDAISASCSVFFFGKYTFKIDGEDRVFMDAVNIQDIPYSCFVENGFTRLIGNPMQTPAGTDDIVVFLGVHDSSSPMPILDTIYTWRAEFYKTQIRVLQDLVKDKRVYAVEFFENGEVLPELSLELLGTLDI